MLKTSVIVPAYNEEKTIARVLSVLVHTDCIDEVIAVNDGSTDHTKQAIQAFPQVKLISLPVNKGKSDAIIHGITKARGDIIVFVDADIVGLKTHHIKKMIRPLQQHKADVVIGYRDALFEPFFRPLCGERAYYRKDLLTLVSHMKDKGYGLELYLNNVFRNERIQRVELTGVNNTLKNDKQSYSESIKTTISECRDLAKEIMKHKNPAKFILNAYINTFYIRLPKNKSLFH